MNDRPDLLHNMSSPPKSVVKYSGLADLSKSAGVSGLLDEWARGIGIFGTPIRFALSNDFRRKTAAGVLRELNLDPSIDPERQLADLINARANDLPLPEGCVVIPFAESHRLIWSDTLTTLAILTKCSESVWLRAKSPALQSALARHRATLLIPPQFAANLPEIA